LVLIGVALIGGFLTQVVPDRYVPDGLRSLGLYVGTNGSVAGAIFGIGLLWAATDPKRNVIWVILTMLYAVLLVVYQAYAAIVLHNPWELPPIIFGVLGGLLVAALYPSTTRPAPIARPAAPPAASPAAAAATTAPATARTDDSPAAPKPAPAHEHEHVARARKATDGGSKK
jgi:hypothetical protein